MARPSYAHAANPPCKWCEGRGCVICGMPVPLSDRQREYSRLQEAAEWMRAERIAPPERQNDLLDVVARAIAHGRLLERGQQEPGELPDADRRWELLEV